jgi:hypothetical protein
LATSLLDALIAEPQFSERHQLSVAAPPGHVYAAVREVTGLEIRPLVPLMAVRALPVAIRHPRRLATTVGQGFRNAGSRPVIEQFLAGGFIELGEDPGHEYAAGAVGRFWTLSDSAPVSLDGAAAFADFAAPGYAKAAFSLTVEPRGGGSLVSTETRVTTTSADARRAFGRYWRLILPGSALIRRSWLAAIRRRAERG